MDLSDALSLILAFISIVVSVFVAYKTLLARFSGKIWPVTEIVLTKISTKQRDNIPVLGMACFLENQGAKSGRLDSLRLVVSNAQVEARHVFYASMMRRDYSILSSYEDDDWFPFGGIGLFEKGKAQEYYVIFKPAEINYIPSPGNYEIVMEALWMEQSEWEEVKPGIKIILTEKMIFDWRSPNTPAFQIKVDGR